MPGLVGLEGVTGRTLEELNAVGDLDSLTQSLDTPYWPLADITAAIALTLATLSGAAVLGVLAVELTEVKAVAIDGLSAGAQIGTLVVLGAWQMVPTGTEDWTETAVSSDNWVRSTPSSEMWA